MIDILRHLPRSTLSDAQHEAIQWCLSVLGISNVPSVRVAKDIDKALQASCGIETKRYEGPLGHVYYANDIGGIIAHVARIESDLSGSARPGQVIRQGSSRPARRTLKLPAG